MTVLCTALGFIFQGDSSRKVLTDEKREKEQAIQMADLKFFHSVKPAAFLLDPCGFLPRLFTEVPI